LDTPRSPTYIGQVRGDDLVGFASPVNIYNRNPRTGVIYGSLEEYFLTIPSVGGAAPVVKIEPVQLIRISIEPVDQESKKGILYYSTWESADAEAGRATAGFVKQKAIYKNLESIAFIRKSVTLPLLEIQLTAFGEEN